MPKINIAKIMIPKALIRLLHEDDTIRQGLEAMSYHGFTAIPVLDKNERYVGCVTEGDFLRHIMETGSTDMKFHEQFKVSRLVREDFCPAVSITADTNTVVQMMLNQNFLPIVDDRNVLCGLLTRKGVILELSD